MSAGREIVAKKPNGQLQRRAEALLPDQPKSKDLTPKVDLPRLRDANPWRHLLPLQSFSYLAVAGGAGGGIMLVQDGSLVAGLVAMTAGAATYLVPRFGLIQTGADDVWAKQISEAHLRKWLADQWGIEAGPDAFKDKDLSKFVNKGSVEKYKFAAVDGKTYKIARLAKGGSVVLTDGFNKEIARTTAALVASEVKIPVSHFNEAGQRAATRIQELMAQLSRTQLSIEQEHVVERSGNILVEASELAARISGLSGAMRQQVDEQLVSTLNAALDDLEQVVAAQTQAAVSDVQVLANYAREVTLKKPSRLTLPPEA